MTTVVVLGSCLTGLSCIWLTTDYKWERPNNAGVFRSDHFVRHFIEQSAYLPTLDEMLGMIEWRDGAEREGKRFLQECFRDTVGHFDVAPDAPGLLETLETRAIDVILMDNLWDSHTGLTYYQPAAGEQAYSLPFSLSHCANEQELAKRFHYGGPMTPEESVENWSKIIRFVKSKQPTAKIVFACAHSCTSVDAPVRYQNARTFASLISQRADDLGISVIPPLELPIELTRMPNDRDHFDMAVYRAIAGHIYLKVCAGL